MQSVIGRDDPDQAAWKPVFKLRNNGFPVPKPELGNRQL